MLNTLVERHEDDDGFEGNAQSFRIVTKFCVHFEFTSGLDLCRATLAACLKYPWLRDCTRPERRKKWGAYRVDAKDFKFAVCNSSEGVRSTEAEIMDWADDISYSVHDLEDFHRCGAIPWRRILDQDADKIIQGAVETWFEAPATAKARLHEAMERLAKFFEPRFYGAIIDEPYEGTRDQRQQLRTMTSELIGRYITASRLANRTITENNGPTVIIDPNKLDEVKILKQITRRYVIENPTLRAQQKGHEFIVNSLFDLLYEGTSEYSPAPYLPRRLEYLWDPKITKARFVADCISSLTESEAIGLWGRLQGRVSGSVLDPIVR